MAAARWLTEVEWQLAAFEPAELREQVTSLWVRESEVRTEHERPCCAVRGFHDRITS